MNNNNIYNEKIKRKKPVKIKQVLMNTKSSDVTNLKFIIFGNSQTGKTSIIRRFYNQKFDPQQELTVGVDLLSKKVKFDNIKIKLNIWDLSGDDHFFEIRNEFYKDCEIGMLVYDITSAISFNKLEKWINEAKKFGFDTMKKHLTLIGNKSDLEKERVITKEKGAEFAIENNLNFFETSSLTGKGIDDSFYELVKKAITL